MTTTNRTRADKRWLALLALLGLSAAGGACDRSHLSSYYGRSYATWFAAQHVHATPSDSEATKRALSGLDAQEAAAVSKNYRHNVGSEGGQGQGQMVMIGQNRTGGEGYTPPPSVPGGQ
ncbi:MAG TPA: hypothetical protein VKZ18_29110 [Polyangia bacterium]|nr:hypothetical protein [Polyangia bacterium]